MVHDPRAWSKLREFLLQWLKVDQYPDLAKDPKRFPGFDEAVASDLRASLDLFLEQARQHEESAPAEGIAKALLFLLYNWQLSHPQVVFRARELDQWVQSGEYERILGGHYLREENGGVASSPGA